MIYDYVTNIFQNNISMRNVIQPMINIFIISQRKAILLLTYYYRIGILNSELNIFASPLILQFFCIFQLFLSDVLHRNIK